MIRRLILLCLPSLLAGFARAATFTVTNTNDSGPGSLRQAVADAVAYGVDTIVFDPALSGATITLATTIDTQTRGSLQINASALPGGVTVSGGGTQRIFGDLSDVRVTFRGVTFTGGNAGTGDGGAIRSIWPLSFYNCTFTGNEAARGGAVWVSDGNLMQFQNCRFLNNRATSGGALYLNKIKEGELTMGSCEFTSNSATQAGGAILLDGSDVVLTSCRFARNTAGLRGGAIAATANTVASLTGCPMDNNLATGSTAQGGAIYSAGTLTVEHCSLFANYAYEGGGLRAVGGSLTMSHSTVARNAASIGGGISCSDPGPCTLTNMTISANTATGTPNLYGGGGIFLWNRVLTLTRSIVAGNSSPTGPDGQTRSGATVTSGDYNFIADNLAFGMTGADHDRMGISPAPLDARLLPPGNYGSSMILMPPLPGSPVVDAVPGSTGSDQRGQARPVDGNRDGTALSDIGAVEAASFVKVTTNADEDDTPPGAALSLREAVRTAPEGAVIWFDPAVFNGTGTANTIVLTRGEIVVRGHVTISAADIPGGVTVDAGLASRHFLLDGTVSLDISPASGASATQSTSYSLTQYQAAAALDASAATFTHTQTNDPAPEWTADLGRDVLMDSITLLNRADCCRDRLSDIRVLLYSEDDTLLYNTGVKNPGNSLNSPALISINFGGLLIPVRKIRVTRDPASTIGSKGVLSIAEVTPYRYSSKHSLSLRNLTLTRGRSTQASPGGSILSLNNSSPVSLHDCQLHNNSPGAIAGGGSLGTLTLTGCLFESNESPTGAGGAISWYGPLTASDSTFRGNSSGSGNVSAPGGAVNGDDSVTLSRCTFEYNRAAGDGGAIYGSRTVTATDCTFRDNTSGGSGGALLSNGATLDRCTFAINTSGGQGGGVCANGESSVQDSTFSGNTAGGSGGGLWWSSGGPLRMDRCTISGNSAVLKGGGLAENGNNGAFITHCTVTGNRVTGTGSTDRGGGVHTENALTVRDCIIAHNTTTVAANGPDIYNSAGNQLTRAGVNLIGNPVGATSVFPYAASAGLANANGDFTSASATPLSAASVGLAPLGDYGGPTLTHVLAPGSLARDRAASSTAIVDQRGQFMVGTPDIGSCESGDHPNAAAWLWETLPFSATAAQHADTFDYDGDGVSNAQEWPARTNPADRASVFRLTGTRQGGALLLSFPTVSGRNYTLLQSTTLAGSWPPAPNQSILPGTGATLHYTVPAPTPGNSTLFYRVQVGP